VRRVLVVVLSLLALALGALWLTGDPLGLFGGAERKTEAPAPEDLAHADPTLQGRPAGAGEAVPIDVEGLPVGTLVLRLGTSALQGVVTGGREPLSRARVEVVLPAGVRGAVRTRPDGTWEVKGLPAGRFDVRASAEGWRTRVVVAPEVAADASAKVEPIDLVRVPELDDGIEVKVTDSFGRPVAGAKVLATTTSWALHLSIGPDLAGEDGVVSKTTTTDERGTALVAPLPPDTYDVVAFAPGYQTSAQPGVLLAAGRIVHLIFRMEPGSSISGTLLDETGKPLAGGFVTGLHQPTWANSLTVESGPDGRFTLDGLREGRYMVIAGHEDHGEVTANPLMSPSGGNRIQLGGAGKVTLTVATPDGKPVTSYRVRPYREQPYGYVFSMVFAVEDPEGKTTLTLPPAVWHLGVQGADGAFREEDTVKVALGETVEAKVVLAPTGVVRGNVTDLNGHVVAGAEVFVRRGGFPTIPSREHYSRTDADGRFEVKGLPLGKKAGLHVRHARYASQVLETDPAPAESAPDVTVRLSSGGRVLGRVTDADGAPVAGERVNLMEGMNYAEARTTATDGSGAYAFDAVSAGKYTVSTGPLEMGSRGISRGEVVVSGVGEVIVDLQRASGATRSVEGLVRRGGQPLAGATVSFLDGRGFGNLVSTVTDAAGRFVGEGILPGRVSIRVDAEDGASSTVTRTIAAEGDVAPIVLDFGTSRISGRIVSAAKTPLSGAWVMVEALAEADTTWARIVAQTTSAQDGTFSSSGLAGGDYQVRISMGGNAPLVTPPFRVADGEAKDLGTLELATGVALSGTVTDDAGSPVEDATISMTDESGRPVFLFSMSTTGSDGSYRVAEVQPGRYTVRFEARGYAPGERSATLTDAAVTVDVVLSRGGEIRVVVQDAAGQPVRGARATLIDARGRPVTRTLSMVNLTDGNLGLSDERGMALIPDLAPSTYRVRVVKEGMVTDGGDQSVTVLPAATAELRVTLRPPT
jgi:protocatechuate 3,4-dioxygenase beta subunit